MLTRPRIAGIPPREPIGAVLSVGMKSPDRGQTIETDRFFVLRSRPVAFKLKDGREVERRELHPAFAWYNELDGNDPRRRTFLCWLSHPFEAQAMDWGLSAKQLPGRMSKKDGGGPWPTPGGFHRPACSSPDGKTATRLYAISEDGKHDWREIECPNLGCEFRMGDKPACGAWSRLYFLPRYDGKAMLPMKWINHSYHSTRNVAGFFDKIHTVASGYGLGPGAYSMVGLPFRLDLNLETRPGKRFPVVSVTPEGELGDWFEGQRMRREMAGGPTRLQIGGQVVDQPAGATDPEEEDALGEDLREVTVPSQMVIGS